jgi:replicative DNA helicase
MRPNDLPDGVIPWSQSAEQAVLGALLQDNGVWDSVGDLLEARHFYDASHALVFTAIAGMVLATKPADVLTVFDQLEKQGKTEADYGGLPYLNSLTVVPMAARNARRYAEIVAEKALLRGLLEAADKVRSLATDSGEQTVAERLDQAQQTLQAVQINGGRSKPTAIQESVVSLIDRIQARADGTEERGYSTGIADLDRLLGGGLKGGKQVVIAARPSVGKSSLAQQICLNLAEAGWGAGFFSQEMTKDELTDRTAANLGHIDLERVISGQLEDGEWSRLTEAVERMRGLPFYLDDQPALTLHDIAAKARMLKRQHDIKAIVVDYIQLCGSSGDKDSRHHQIEALSRGLKSLSKQLDITVITLSQLNREVEKRVSGRPTLSDLKESGAIEEDADVVILLSRQGDEQDGFRVINCDIPKNRQGRTGAISLGFNGRHQEWHAVARPVEFKQPARRHYTEDV